MKVSKQWKYSIAVKRLPALVGAFCVITAVGVLFVVDRAFANPYPTVTQGDLDEDRVYSPYAGRAYPDQVFFGDMHFHTNLSVATPDY